MTALVTPIPRELAGYLEGLIAALGDAVELEAVYLIGSAARGAYEPGRSDVDVIAVTTAPLADDEKRELAQAAEALPVPARKLELVVYPQGSNRWQVNLNTGEHVGFDPDAEPAFWFVLDRASAEQHSVPLLGPPWRDLFAPITRQETVAAIAEALDWHEQADPLGRSSVLNACRSWVWLETGDWVTKQDAARWLRAQLRQRLEEER